MNLERLLDEKNFNYIYLDNFTDKRIVEFLNYGLAQSNSTITEYRNFCGQSYLSKLLCKQTLAKNSVKERCENTVISLKVKMNNTVGTTSNPRRFDVDITSIRRRPNFDKFPRHFRVLFRCNFNGRKIHVVSTYFFRCNFDGRNMHIVFTYLFRRNFDAQRFDIVFGKM